MGGPRSGAEVEHSQGAPGTATTRDGRELFYMRRPGAPDAPTVVFESGLAASRSYWAPAQVAVADRAPTVVYDRSGLGRSAPDGHPRTLQRLAADLGDLLDHLGPGPFVLVGHSWGGPIVRIAAAANPARIAGLVLLDHTDEACDLFFHPSVRRAEKIGQAISSLLARLGLLAFAHRDLLAPLPDDAKAEMRAEGFTVGTIRTRAAELASVVADMTALRDDPLDPLDVPVTVISAGRTSTGMNARIRAALNASHEHRAEQHRLGRHVYAPNSGHLVPTGDPELVAAEIHRMLP
ncbi:alpha/beta hydrolase [Saccharopolyspora indica]|uniref:alpha/beta fold hydrolase n=1 Tax=Saccharopolyspora indica TaxID=1229659 RepID=UPI0022EB6483|nr:alpha/beta hydrolase [Saccharopolyspora indica]MDA3649878.1 alpha/beta hydrolase [Saccharopolyspora indica]